MNVLALEVGGFVVAVLLLAFAFSRRYRKVGPNQALVISGRCVQYRNADGRIVRRGFRILSGGGTFVWPIIEKADVLSLELMTIEFRNLELHTRDGVPVLVDAVAHVKICGEASAIATAAEQFLGKSQDEVLRIAQQTLERPLRSILGAVTIEEIRKKRDAVAQQVQKVAVEDMAQMGMGIDLFTIRSIRPKEGYAEPGESQ